MIKTKVCPKCHSETLAFEKTCPECGAAFSTDQTMRAGNLWPAELLNRHVTKMTEPPPGTILFKFVGRPTPLLVEMKPEITLGRYISGKPAPTIDLTPQHAGLMGVSRQHVKLRFEDAQATIEDLASTNGTYLNGEQLEPNETYVLECGAQIRLGQFVFYISYTMLQ